jgi:hypothetical protein
MSTTPRPVRERIAPEDAEYSQGAPEFTVADILSLLLQRLRLTAFGWLRRSDHGFTRDAPKRM